MTEFVKEMLNKYFLIMKIDSQHKSISDLKFYIDNDHMAVIQYKINDKSLQRQIRRRFFAQIYDECYQHYPAYQIEKVMLEIVSGFFYFEETIQRERQGILNFLPFYHKYWNPLIIYPKDKNTYQKYSQFKILIVDKWHLNFFKAENAYIDRIYKYLKEERLKKNDQRQ